MEELSLISRQEPGIATIDNFQELKQALEQQLEAYKSLAYSQDSIKAAKKDKAMLNKLKKVIDDKRKEIKRVYHFQEVIAGCGDRPTIFLVVIHDQTVSFGGIPKLAVVVGVASAAILNPIHMVVIVNHFVQKGCCHFFNGAGQCSGADVDFVSTADLGNPGVLSQREVSIGFWRGLDGDGGS